MDVCIWKENYCISCCGKIIFAQSLPPSRFACELFWSLLAYFWCWKTAIKKTFSISCLLFALIHARNERRYENREEERDCLVTRLMKSTIVLYEWVSGEVWRDISLIFLERFCCEHPNALMMIFKYTIIRKFFFGDCFEARRDEPTPIT